MNIFLPLFFKISPLYLIIILGFITSKYLNTQKETVAKLLIYVIAPVVIFNSVLTTKLSLSVLSLPIIFFTLCCIICLVTFYFVKKIWQDPTKNILAFTSGSGNTGYFGLPVAIALLGSASAGLVMIFTLGYVLYESSLGFYIVARGNNSVKESIKRVLKLPAIYAFIVAVIINLLGIKFGQDYFEFANLFRGAYSILGMMLIGMGLASVTNYKLDFKFISIALLTKFVIWPAVVLFLIFLDKSAFHFFDLQIYKVMILLSIVPLAANTVAFATELKAQPEKASIAVLISTVIALFYIPLIASWFAL